MFVVGCLQVRNVKFSGYLCVRLPMGDVENAAFRDLLISAKNA